LNVFGATAVLFSTVYGAQKKFTKRSMKRKASYEIQSKLSLEISQVYNHIVYLQNQEKLYFYLDSLYQNFLKTSRRFELGETNYLEKITAQAKFRQIKTSLSQIKSDKSAHYDFVFH
jgi:cobalt-zinc-cadmium resistance protein CzcA